MSLEPVTNFKDSNGADLGTKLITKDYLISVYPSIADKIGISPELWNWGFGINGYLGNNSNTSRSTPVTTFAGGTNWKQVSSSFSVTSQSAAIKTDGTLWTWGRGGSGALGINIATALRSTPVTTFAGGSDWKQVSCGSECVLAIKTDGTLWVWGKNSNGQLGTNDVIFRVTPVTTFVGGTNWKQIDGSAAIKTDGTLWTWGPSGGLGRLNISDISLTPVTTFAGGTDWANTLTDEPEDLYTINAGSQGSATIKTDGTLWTWGNVPVGRNDSISFSPTPTTTFSGGTNWKQVSLGNLHIATIKTDGTLWTWGYGFNGLLGNNDTTNRLTPVTTFAGGTNWKQVSCGGNSTAAIKTDGTLWTWGGGFNGALGTNDTINRSTPVTTFAGGTNWKQVSCGGNSTAAIKTDGTLWIWGNGFNGLLGNNNTTNRLTPVTTFAGGTDWKQVSSGSGHTAAIKTNGTLWTWGSGFNGALGTNDTITRSTPVTTFAGGTNWKQVSSGGGTAAIKTDGTLWTWGLGINGRLGTNDTINRSTPVTTFAGGTNWKQVSSGGNHIIALQDDGVNKELYVFGSNSSCQLGFFNNALFPGEVFGNFTNWKQVSSVSGIAAAIKTDGTLWTWGYGSRGQLGTNDTINRFTPVTTFAGGTDWKQVSSSYRAVSAIKTDGTLWTWGYGRDGSLGNNSTTDRSTPVTTFAGGTNWKQVRNGSFYSAAIKTDGTLWTWGQGSFGQLGNNSTVSRSTPVTTFAGGTDWKQVSAGYFIMTALKSTDF